VREIEEICPSDVNSHQDQSLSWVSRPEFSGKYIKKRKLWTTHKCGLERGIQSYDEQ